MTEKPLTEKLLNWTLARLQAGSASRTIGLREQRR